MTEFYFTITAGRTGTGWLSDFIKNNLRITSIHEPLGIDDFGVQMPDIKTMRMFNERGLNEFVIEFWQRKFDGLKHHDRYAESNHTLSKCGLLEYAAKYCGDDNFTFFCIRRNRVKQCLSYLNRGDFQNITIDWQWYLNYRYKKNIVKPDPLLQFGRVGVIFWYIFEIEVRQEYYKILYHDKFNFIDLKLETMTQQAGAKSLLMSLGIKSEPILGDKKNENIIQTNVEQEKHVSNILSQISFDSVKTATEFVASGNRLG